MLPLYIYISESFYICVTSRPCSSRVFLPQQPWHLSIWSIECGCNLKHTVEQLLQELGMDAPFGPEEKPIFRTKGHGFQRVAIRNSQDFRFNGSALKAVQCQGSVENLAWILTSHTILETKRGLDTGTLPTHLKLKGGFMPSASPQSESATTFVYLKTNPSIFCCEHIFIHMSSPLH